MDEPAELLTLNRRGSRYRVARKTVALHLDGHVPASIVAFAHPIDQRRRCRSNGVRNPPPIQYMHARVLQYRIVYEMHVLDVQVRGAILGSYKFPHYS